MLLLPSEFRKVLKYINERLIRWVMRKYKRFSKGKKFSKAYEWLARRYKTISTIQVKNV